MNLWLIFLTGLTVGGLTCLAVQGGLLASVIAAREKAEVDKKINTLNNLWPIITFLLAKFIAYGVLGFLLGGFGTLFSLSPEVQTIMQFLAGIYMLGIAFNLLNIHPIFRFFIIQPPRFLTKLVRNQSQSQNFFAPSLLGLMTVFIPCGTTLAMEAFAISSANPILGAAIMGTFTLGTFPLFFGIGYITSFLGDKFRDRFLKLAAVAVIYLGITSVNGSLVAMGSPVTLQSITENLPLSIGSGPDETTSNVNQEYKIDITSSGYYPGYIKVRKGLPVKLTLSTKDAYSCASAFRIPSLKIARNLKPNDLTTIEFTPEKIGKIPFSCSMGMYRGVIEVI